MLRITQLQSFEIIAKEMSSHEQNITIMSSSSCKIVSQHSILDRRISDSRVSVAVLVENLQMDARQ